MKKWTTREINQVKEWQLDGVPGPEQARRLGRGIGSWRNAVKRYKISKKDLDEPYTHYDERQRMVVMEMLPNGCNQKAVAKYLGVAHSKVSRMVAELMARGLLTRKNRRGPYSTTRLWGSRSSD